MWPPTLLPPEAPAELCSFAATRYLPERFLSENFSITDYLMSPPLIVVFVRPEVCGDVGRIIQGAKGVAVTSDPRSTADLSREDCYRVLSGLHLQILRRYASLFPPIHGELSSHNKPQLIPATAHAR